MFILELQVLMIATSRRMELSPKMVWRRVLSPPGVDARFGGMQMKRKGDACNSATRVD